MILDFFNNLENFRDGETFTVDRFENNAAILENRETGKMINVSIFKLPNNLKEGDILSVLDGSFILNNEETQNVQQDIQSKFDKLKKRILEFLSGSNRKEILINPHIYLLQKNHLLGDFS